MAFAGVLLLFTAWTYAQGGTLDPTARDQSADMTLGLQIARGGAMSDGNRHPLLPAILSFWAGRRPGYFVDARLVSVLLASLALAALYAAASRRFSPRLALLAAVVYVLELRFEARRVCPEPLTAACLVGATFFLSGLPSARRAFAPALAGGAALGLAWLSKGTALLSLVAATAWILLAMRRRGLVPALLVWLAFAAAAAPLLVHNAREHGSPFFNANSTHVMWEDAWDQDLDKTSTATLGSYVRTHDVGEMVSRLASGLTRQGGVEWVYGFLALVVVARLASRRRGGASGAALGAPPRAPRASWRGLAIVTCLVWLPPLAWYAPIVDSRRLLFPIFAILIPPALDVLASFVPDRVGGSPGVHALGRAARGAALPFAVAALAGSVALAIAHGNPLKEKHLDDATIALAERLQSPEYRDAGVLAKPSRTVPPDWMVYERVRLDAIPKAVSDEDAPAWIAKRDRYVLVSSGFLAQRKDHAVPSAFASWDDAKGIVPKALPPWLVEDWRDPGTPSRYWLLRVVSPGGG